MHLKKITLTNIRCLGEGQPLVLELEPLDGTLAGWHVIAGPNGAGKSTLLRAIALGCAGPGTIKTLMPSRTWWMSAGAKFSKLAVELDKGPHDSWRLSAKAHHEGAGIRGKVSLEISVDRPNGMRGTGGPHTPHTGPWTDADMPAGWFVAGYGAMRHLPDGLSLPSHPVSEAQTRTQLISLFKPALALIDSVAWIKQLELDGDGFLPEIQSLISDGLLSGSKKPAEFSVDSDGLMLRESGRWLPLSALSDGYQVVIGLVLDLIRHLAQTDQGLMFDPDGRLMNEGIVLVDEIEAHLHPRWQRSIGDWMVAHFPNIQFIVTTHSPFICQAATSGCIIRLARADEPVASRVIAPAELESIVAGTADDLYLSGLFSVDSTRSDAARRDLERAGHLEARILDNLATPAERDEYRALKRRLPPSSAVERALEAVSKRAS